MRALPSINNNRTIYIDFAQLLTFYPKFNWKAVLVVLAVDSDAEDTAFYAVEHQSREGRQAVSQLVSGEKGINEGEQQKSKMGQNKAQRVLPKTLGSPTSTTPSKLRHCSLVYKYTYLWFSIGCNNAYDSNGCHRERQHWCSRGSGSIMVVWCGLLSIYRGFTDIKITSKIFLRDQVPCHTSCIGLACVQNGRSGINQACRNRDRDDE